MISIRRTASPARRATCAWMATSVRCISFTLVVDFTSVTQKPPSAPRSRISTATYTESARKLASYTTGAPEASAVRVASRRASYASWGRSISTPPGTCARATSPTRRPRANTASSIGSGVSSAAPGSCTRHQSCFAHWIPATTRDLERPGGRAGTMGDATLTRAMHA